MTLPCSFRGREATGHDPITRHLDVKSPQVSDGPLGGARARGTGTTPGNRPGRRNRPRSSVSVPRKANLCRMANSSTNHSQDRTTRCCKESRASVMSGMPSRRANEDAAATNEIRAAYAVRALVTEPRPLTGTRTHSATCSPRLRSSSSTWLASAELVSENGIASVAGRLLCLLEPGPR